MTFTKLHTSIFQFLMIIFVNYPGPNHGFSEVYMTMLLYSKTWAAVGCRTVLLQECYETLVFLSQESCFPTIRSWTKVLCWADAMVMEAQALGHNNLIIIYGQNASFWELVTRIYSRNQRQAMWSSWWHYQVQMSKGFHFIWNVCLKTACTWYFSWHSTFIYQTVTLTWPFLYLYQFPQ